MSPSHMWAIRHFASTATSWHRRRVVNLRRLSLALFSLGVVACSIAGLKMLDMAPVLSEKTPPAFVFGALGIAFLSFSVLARRRRLAHEQLISQYISVFFDAVDAGPDASAIVYEDFRKRLLKTDEGNFLLGGPSALSNFYGAMVDRPPPPPPPPPPPLPPLQAGGIVDEESTESTTSKA